MGKWDRGGGEGYDDRGPASSGSVLQEEVTKWGPGRESLKGETADAQRKAADKVDLQASEWKGMPHCSS